jgi:molybdenum cofactor cytidylyltransferase
MGSAEHQPTIAAVILAAGSSCRFGQRNKLLEPVLGQPLLRIAALAALQSQVDTTIVVTGFEGDKVKQSLSDMEVTTVHNPDYATGMASSLRTGISAAREFDAVLIMLADMPKITSALLDTLIQSFYSAHATTIIAPVHDGQRGNPVLWPKRYFTEIMKIEGDTGARGLLNRYANRIREIDVRSNSIFVDVDTQSMLVNANTSERDSSYIYSRESHSR